ncbi:MAG: UDP-N-acetylmuramoyl-tripeptide--D-alanyl-D-alanine ligase [Candidatus Omnitrophica bacterium]|nr:UDP-N-acetylmuramoyl-tripeptide--D-alanyl-D-alanine ligase [Candidatus Omnitrophota bacterium]
MLNLNISDIEKMNSVLAVSKDRALPFAGIDIDSRVLKPGNFFVAIKGVDRDGNDHRMAAIEAGAAGIISELAPNDMITNTSASYIQVSEIDIFLKELIKLILEKYTVKIIAITGTCGKTSVKEFLAQMLSPEFEVLKSPASYNNLYGLALTLCSIKRSTEIAVLECGTNHPGEISVLSNLIRPHTVILTNVGEGHLENFKNIAGVMKEKISIVEGLREGGTLFFNGDQDELNILKLNSKIKAVSFGFTGACDHKINIKSYAADGVAFSLDNEVYSTKLSGKHNIYNLAAAMSAANFYGVHLDGLKEKIRKIDSVKLRFEKTLVDDVYFIFDCYNANPLSFRAALSSLMEDNCSGRKMVVAGDMLELGEESDILHFKTGKNIHLSGAEFLFSYGEKGKVIAQGAISSGMKKENVFSFMDIDKLACKIKQISKKDDVILVKGSRKLKMEGIKECFTTSCIR